MSKRDLNEEAKFNKDFKFEDKESKFSGKGDSESKKSGKKRRRGNRGKGFKGKEFNSPDWHSKNGQMLKDVASIPFNRMLGFPISIETVETGKKSDLQLEIPFLLTIEADWVAGPSDKVIAILNTAANNIWTFIRSRNSGATNYEYKDILMTMIGTIDIYANISYCERIFKLAKIFSDRNRMVPKIYFDAMNIDYRDFISNIANYRGMFNKILARADSLVMPKSFPIVNAVMAQFQCLYKDADTNTGREQEYLTIKARHHIYDPKRNPNGGMVRLMRTTDLDSTLTDANIYTGTGTTVSNLVPVKFDLFIRILNAQLDAILTDEDCNIIFGDMIKAYGDEKNFVTLSALTEDVDIAAEYSEEFSIMLENSTVFPCLETASYDFGTILPGSNTNIPYSVLETYASNTVQDPALGIITDLYVVPSSYNANTQREYVKCYSSKVILNTREENPDPTKVLMMTRGSVISDVEDMTISGSRKLVLRPKAYGTFIYSNMTIWSAAVSDGSSTRINIYQAQRHDNFNIASLAKTMAFKSVPFIKVCDATADNTRFEIINDVNNLAVVDRDTLQNIHNEDIMSLFDVPFSKSF